MKYYSKKEVRLMMAKSSMVEIIILLRILFPSKIIALSLAEILAPDHKN